MHYLSFSEVQHPLKYAANLFNAKVKSIGNNYYSVNNHIAPILLCMKDILSFFPPQNSSNSLSFFLDSLK